MATQGVVVSRANDDTPAIGGLFKDISFFITQRVPMRSSFLDRVKANGGRIVKIEPAATYIIADHLRHDCPPNSLSYTFIETAIKTGALPDPNRHRAGPTPGVVHPVGSTIVPRKATRTEFTAQDDRDLWTWVQQCVQQGVHSVKGLEMYKQLEAVNPRHTTQSWRDRYLKRLVNNPPQGVMPAATGSTVVVPPAPAPRPLRTVVNGVMVDPRNTEANGQAEDADQQGEEEEEEEEDSDQGDEKEDFVFLINNIDDLLCVPEEDKDTMWGMLAEQPASSHRNAGQWKTLYEDKVLPAYEKKQQKNKKVALASPSKAKPRPSTPEPIESPKQDVELSTPEMVAMRAKAARERDPSPSSTAQKRKRKTATPRSSTYGRKRTKADHSDLFTDDVPADDLAKQAASASKAKSQTALEAVVTSEANRAAKAQLVAEANLPDAELESRVLDHLTEADAAAPADKAGSHEDDIDEEANMTPEEVTPKQSKRTILKDGFPDVGSRLTAQNLTEKQAEANGRPTRATDLPIDEEQVSHYAEYLQGLVNATTQRLVNEPDEGVLQNLIDAHLEKERQAAPVRADDDLESDRELSPENDGVEGELQTNGGDTNGNLTTAQISRAQELSRSVEGLFAPRAGNAEPANNETQNGAEKSNGEKDGEMEIDLTLAEPEGGFSFSSQDQGADQQADQHQWEQPQQRPQRQAANAQIEISSDRDNTSDENEKMEEGPATAMKTKARALDTQGIYAAGTQHPDLSFPLPPDSDPPISEPDLPIDPVVPPPAAQKSASKPGALKRPSAATRKSSGPPAPARSQPAAPPSKTMQSFLQRFTAKGCSPQSLRDALYRTSGNIEVAELVVMAERFHMPVPDLPAIWSAEDDALVGATDASVVNRLMERKGWQEYEVRINFLQDWRAQK